MNGNIETFRELPEDLNPDVEEMRCVNCGRFLGLVALVEGTVVIKCRRCKIWSVIDVSNSVAEAVSTESSSPGE